MGAPQITLDLARQAFDDEAYARCEAFCLTLNSEGISAETECLRGRSILKSEGRASDALQAFQQAMIVDDRNTVAYVGAGNAYLRLGQLEAAQRTLEDVRARGANDPEFASLEKVVAVLGDGAGTGDFNSSDYLLLGQSYNGARRFDEAKAALDQALGDEATDAAAMLALTRTYGGLGAIDDILETLRRLRDRVRWYLPDRRRPFADEIVYLCRSLDQVRPDHALTLAILGTVLAENLPTAADGRNTLNRAEKLNSEVPDIYLGAGISCLRTGEYSEAADHLSTAARGMDGFAEPRERHAHAVAIVDGRAGQSDFIAGQPPAALHQLAEILAVGRHYAEADTLLRTAIQGAPREPDFLTMHAAVLSTTGRTDESLVVSEKARSIVPDSPAANLEMATNLLAKGRLGEAWDVYDHRLNFWRKDSIQRDFSAPAWNGEELTGKTLLVWREEGVGDEMRFASVLPDLQRLGDFRLIVECGPRLRTLFERSFPGIEFRDEDPDGTDTDEIDFHLPILSLPRFFRRAIEDFPTTHSYLTADPARVAKWQAYLNDLDDRPKVGIGWQSLNRSWRKWPVISTLSDWDAVTGREDLFMVNLQCEVEAGEFDAARHRTGRSIHVITDTDIKNDLEEAAALMAALDVVVGARCWVPTTAGAVGSKAFCVTPKPNPFMFNLDHDPWSPTIEIVYRETGEGWPSAIERVNERLSTYLGLADPGGHLSDAERER